MTNDSNRSQTADSATDSASPGDKHSDADDTGNARDRERGAGGRDVVVPMRLYKTVTVFSTLIAILCVVGGFVLLDAATLQVSFLRAVLTSVLRALGLSIAASVLNIVLAITGLLVIAFGAGVYVLGTRFRAPGMGNSQEDSSKDSGNG